MATEAVLAELVARIKADTSQLDRALAALPGKTEQSARKMESAFSISTRAAAGLILALGVREVISYGKELFAAADQMKNLSQQTDFAISSLASLDILLTKNGSNLQQLSAAASILQANIGGAAAGNEELIKKFDALHLSVTKLQAIGPERAFYAVTQALYDLNSASKTADLGRDLLGRGFRSLTPTIKDAKGALGDYVDQANRLHGKEVEDAVNKIDEMGDKFDELSRRIKQGAMIELAAVIDIIERIGRLIDKLPSLPRLLPEWAKNMPPGPGVGIMPSDISRSLKNRDMQQWIERQKERGGVTTFTPTWEWDAGATSAKGNNKDIATGTEQLSQSQKDATRILEMTRTAQEKYDAAIANASQLLKTHKIDQDTFNRYQQQMQQELDKTGTAFDKAGDRAEVFAINVKDYIGDAFESAIFDAKNFSGAMSSILDGIARKIARQTIIDPLSSGISDFIKGSDIGKSISSFLGFGGARAGGGPVSAGASYLVGERGPEIFTPSMSGGITPNHRMGGGGVTVHQHFNISTGVVGTVRAELMQILPAFADVTKNAVYADIQRGGAGARLVGARS